MVRAAMPQARLQRLDSREGVQIGRHPGAVSDFRASLRGGAAPAVCRRVSAGGEGRESSRYDRVRGLRGALPRIFAHSRR